MQKVVFDINSSVFSFQHKFIEIIRFIQGTFSLYFFSGILIKFWR